MCALCSLISILAVIRILRKDYHIYHYNYDVALVMNDNICPELITYLWCDPIRGHRAGRGGDRFDKMMLCCIVSVLSSRKPQRSYLDLFFAQVGCIVSLHLDLQNAFEGESLSLTKIDLRCIVDLSPVHTRFVACLLLVL